MKQISKFILAAFALSALTSGFVGCQKKGEEDPGMSIHSRKARVVGEWNLTAMVSSNDWVQTWADANPTAAGDQVKSESNRKMTYDGTSITESNLSKDTDDNGDFQETKSSSAGNSITSDVTTNTGGVSLTTTGFGTYGHTLTVTYTFEKDGKFKMTKTSSRKEEYKTSVTAYDLTNTITNDESETQEGTWTFIGKDKTNEHKNKERIGLWYSSDISTNVSNSQNSYNDKDANDGINYATLNSGTKRTDELTVTNKDSNPDEIWELVELKNKEMKFVASGKYVGSTKTTNSTTTGSLTTSTNSTGTYTSNWETSGTLTAK